MLDVSDWQSGPPFFCGDPEEGRLIEAQAEEAKAFVESQKWAPPISNIYFAWGIGGVIALFLVRFANKIKKHADEEIWVVAGNVPSAYFVTDDAKNVRDAMDIYCDLMEDWVAAVRSGGRLDDVFPVRAAATLENADMLASRLQSIRQDLLADV